LRFAYQHDNLACDGAALADIAAAVGTPCYIYSAAAILDQFHAYDKAFDDTPHLVCYAVKANGNLSILRLLAEAGAGFDIVSGGELYRVLHAGGDASKVAFSGAGKTADEMRYGLESGVGSFHCESAAEIDLLAAVAEQLGRVAHAGLRVNPGVSAATHPYIATGLRSHKFGVDMADAAKIFEGARQHRSVKLDTVSFHIGSQLLDTQPIAEAVRDALELIRRLRGRGFAIESLDIGGGLGVQQRPDDRAPNITEFVQAICALTAGLNLRIVVEPGRSIVAGAGLLVTRVLYRKQSGAKHFIVVDAAMNDLIRPSLYQAHHEVLPLRETTSHVVADLVGPVCETGDFFALDRLLPNAQPGDFLAIATAGAYGFAQASNYNGRPRPAEVLIESDGSYRVVRERETYADLIHGE